MVITILEQKYKVGCEKGITDEEQDKLHVKLNLVVEWDKCEWPKDSEGNPNTKYLGDEPELKPGDCFFYDGNVIALDRKDRLILIVSETGPGALRRICNEIINEEFKYLGCSAIDDIKCEVVDNIPDTHTKFPVPFYKMRTFHEKFIFGRYNPGDILKCEVKYICPIEVYISDWNIAFDMNDLDDDKEMVEYLRTEIFGWFYNNYSRNLPPKPEKPEELPVLGVNN